MAAAFVLGRAIVSAVARRRTLDAGQRRTLVKTAGAFGLVALAPALLIGIVVGGTLGAAYGEGGVALGTFAVVALVLCAAVAAGAWVGRLLADRGKQ